ncbi:hypothetical protein L1D40_05535 [Shewanella insulae]|uniref:hypothetical protein n=1 Tax=Shewanella insulae TaxID=2681496 RepID=UPI001EFE6590|nr:hypothetical protein [Shewanella insulae]MCG9754693.1 hypothetical protein [Shewanella insulae]
MKFKCFVLFSCLFSLSSFACESSSVDWANELKESRQLDEEFALEVANNADIIGIGRATKVIDVDVSYGYKQRVFFEIEEILKGPHQAEVSALMSKIEVQTENDQVEELYVCGKPIEPSIDDAYAVRTYKYLFYIRNDVLIRASTYLEAPLPMLPQEEIDLLIREKRITRP